MGATWTYDWTDPVNTATLVNVVEALEPMDGTKAGITAFRRRMDQPAGEPLITWYEDLGDKAVLHKTQHLQNDAPHMTYTYEPHWLILDEGAERTAQGAIWTESFVTRNEDGSTVPDSKTWTVLGTDVPVTVPAGTFSCLHLSYQRLSETVVVNEWWARGVGRVKASYSHGGELELASYSIP